MTTERVRKQVYELTADDLERHPVWEFALDEEGEEGQDEATVRPYNTEGSLDPSEGMFVIRAWLTLADGTRLRGYLTPPVQGDSSLGTLQPAVIAKSGQVSFWCGMVAPPPAFIQESYVRLGKSSSAYIFPLTFESDVALATGVIKGNIPGFLVLEDFKTMRTRVVK